jgi:hypothetical protein
MLGYNWFPSECFLGVHDKVIKFFYNMVKSYNIKLIKILNNNKKSNKETF